jgi:hypothetical protein
VACFSSLKNQHLRTTFCTHFTIFSPHKYHVLYTVFSKTPLKNTCKALQKPLNTALHQRKKKSGRKNTKGQDRSWPLK